MSYSLKHFPIALRQPHQKDKRRSWTLSFTIDVENSAISYSFSYDISVAIFGKRFINFYRKEKRPRPQFECLIVTFSWIRIGFYVSVETKPISHIRHNRS